MPTLEDKEAIVVDIKTSENISDIIRCRYLISDRYNKYYDIFFSTGNYDLNAKIEPYPDRYIMAMVDGELMGCLGLYNQNIYIEEFGNVSRDDIKTILTTANVESKYNDYILYEMTKYVVKSGLVGTEFSKFLFKCAYSQAFFNPNNEPVLLGCCGKVSMFDYLYHFSNIVMRPIKPFPKYKVHEQYVSERNPMESRLVIPCLDIPKVWYNLSIPQRYVLNLKNGTFQECE